MTHRHRVRTLCNNACVKYPTLLFFPPRYLDADAIRRTMGSGTSDTEVDDMISSMDERHNGKINYIDFLRFWRRLIREQTITPKQRLQGAVKRTVSMIRAANAFSTRASAVAATAAVETSNHGGIKDDITVSTGPASVFFPAPAHFQAPTAAMVRRASSGGMSMSSMAMTAVRDESSGLGGGGGGSGRDAGDSFCEYDRSDEAAAALGSEGCVPAEARHGLRRMSTMTVDDATSKRIKVDDNDNP